MENLASTIPPTDRRTQLTMMTRSKLSVSVGWSLLGRRYGQVQLELGREFFLGVETVREVDASDTTVGVDLRSQAGINK